MTVAIIPLHRPQAAELEFALCFYCKAVLPDSAKYRTLGKTSLGFRNFCKHRQEDAPEHSCYQRFSRSFK